MERVLYTDLLRLISVFAVVFLHVAANQWYDFAPSSYEWQIFNFYDAAVRWCVPLFFMLSGAFLLDFRRYGENFHENTVRVFKKNILKIAVALIAWSFIYAVCLNIAGGG